MLDACSIIGLGRSAAAAKAGPGSSLGDRMRDRRSFDRPGACYFTGDRNRYLLPDDPSRMAACASPNRHRIELRVDPAENFARSTTVLWPSTWKRSSICSIRPVASVVRQVADPSTHGGIHCTDR